MATIERGWRRLLQEIGIAFHHPEALRLFRARGPDRRGGRRASSTPTSCSSWSPRRRRRSPCTAAIPSAASRSAATHGLRPRRRARRSCARETSGATATFDDYRRFTKLAQVYDDFDTAGGLSCEPNDLPLDSRHLDMQLALLTLTDKPYGGAQVSLDRRARLARDGRAWRSAAPRRWRASRGMYTVVNVNSPLLYDERMLDALLTYAAPASRDRDAVPADGRDVAGLDPVRARAADGRGAGRRRPTQLVRPGHAGRARLLPLAHRHAVGLAGLRRPRGGDRPVLLRPDRAAPRPAVALGRRRAHEQPGARCAGRLRGPQHDAAGLPGGRELRHAHGRLARIGPRRPATRSSSSTSRSCARCARSSRRSRSTRRAWPTAPTRKSATAATSSAPSTRWSASATASTGPLLSSTENFERWKRNGGSDSAERATAIWQEALDRYEQPPMDERCKPNSRPT